MRTTLTIDDDIAFALKDRARATGRSFEDVVNEVMRRGIAADAKPLAGRPRFKVVSSRRGFQPEIDPLELNQLVDELEVEGFLRGQHGAQS